MDVTSTASTQSIVKKLISDYPALTFREAANFLWIPHESIIEYQATGDPVYLLHEVGHALLSHDSYKRDVELLTIERSAWSYAREQLAKSYAISISEQVIEDALDTYREWLHARSTCPSCNLNGVQTNKYTYRCVSCDTTWTVNEAKGCQLRRHNISK